MSNTPDNIRNMWEEAAKGNKDIGTDRDDPFRATRQAEKNKADARVARENRWAAQKEAERAKKPADS